MREAVRSVNLDPNTAYVIVTSADVLHAEFTTLVSWLEEAIEANRMKPPRNRS